MLLHTPTRIATIEKYRAIKTRFEHLYNTKRVRYDDVIQQLAQEYFCSEQTILRVLKTDLPDNVTPFGLRLKQVSLFEQTETATV